MKPLDYFASISKKNPVMYDALWWAHRRQKEPLGFHNSWHSQDHNAIVALLYEENQPIAALPYCSLWMCVVRCLTGHDDLQTRRELFPVFAEALSMQTVKEMAFGQALPLLEIRQATNEIRSGQESSSPRVSSILDGSISLNDTLIESLRNYPSGDNAIDSKGVAAARKLYFLTATRWITLGRDPKVRAIMLKNRRAILDGACL